MKVLPFYDSGRNVVLIGLSIRNVAHGADVTLLSLDPLGITCNVSVNEAATHQIFVPFPRPVRQMLIGVFLGGIIMISLEFGRTEN